MTRFKIGEIVRISNDLTRTQREFGLDEDGEMESMRGKTFPIKDRSSTWVSIDGPRSHFGFTFYISDVQKAEFKEPDPIIVDFDTRHLDI